MESEEERIAAVKISRRNLEYIDNPSAAVQLTAVEHDGYAIQYIENPSEVVQLAAVDTDPGSIFFIKNPSEFVQLAVIAKFKNDPFSAAIVAELEVAEKNYMKLIEKLFKK
jgi:hypothetical protein